LNDFISIVIPAYNEESRIQPTLEKVSAYCKDRFRDFEIIVVDDGSTDNTLSVVKNLGQHLENINLMHYPKNAGKGFAVRKGVLSSRGDLLLISDADLSTPIEELEKLISYIHADSYDIAIGSRGLKESDILLKQPWYREMMGKTFNIFVRMVAISGIKDTQCGFKLFRGDIARDLFKRCSIDGFSFDVEVLYLAKNAGHKIKEVPVRWVNSPSSKVELIRDPLVMLLELLKIRINSLTGKYTHHLQKNRDAGRKAERN
jgi:dolichyl-phosphate beta-glucosyltransferase